MSTSLIVTTPEQLNELIQKAVNNALNTSKQTNDQWLSRKQTAKYLNISESKLNDIKKTNEQFPKPHSTGKKIYFLKSELDQWKLSNRI